MRITKTLHEVASLWKKAKRTEVKKSSFVYYEHLLEKHLLPYFGDMSDVKEKAVQRYVRKKSKEGLKVRTLKSHLVVLKMVTSYGVKKRWLRMDMWTVKYPEEAVAEGRKVLSAREYKQLHKLLLAAPSNKTLGILLSLTAGLRIGEVCGLQWGDIDWDNGTLTIRRTVERIYSSRSTEVIINTPKTKTSARCVPIDAAVLAMARKMRKRSGQRSYVLSNSRKPVEPRMLRHYFYTFLERHGLPRLRFHALRHSFATRCVESNCDYKTISQILGHSSINTTMNLYVHPDMEQKRRCLTLMLDNVINAL